MKRLKFRHPTNKVLIGVLVLIVALQTALLWFYGQKINNLGSEINGYGTPNQQVQNGLAGFPIKEYIQASVKGLYRNSGIVDPLNDRVYVPEIKVYLPLNQTTRDLRYFADSSAPSQATEVEFSSATVLDRLVNSFDEVPCQQRLAGASLGAPSSSLQDLYGQAAGSLKLKDGRSLYFYKSNSAGCSQFWQTTPQDVVNALKEAKSY